MPINNLGTARGKIDVDSSSLKNADISLRSAGRGMLYFGAVAVGAFGAVVNEAAKFEKEMSFVQAVTNASGAEMDALKAKAIEMGKKSVFGPVALSQAFTDMVKAGASVDQMLSGLAEAAVALAQAADVPIPFAGENLLNILNTYKLSARDAVKVTDTLAGAANASSIELADIVASMQYVGPVAQAMGVSIEDTAASLTLLGKIGLKGSIAGTSLRMALARLTGVSGKAKDALEGVGLSVKDGIVQEFHNADGTMKDMGGIMEVLRVATQKLSGEAKVTFTKDVFGIRAMPAMIELMGQGAAGFKAINEEIGRTTAADVARKRLDNLSGSIARLKSTIQTMMTEAGGPFQNMLKGWVDGLRNMLLWFDNLPGPLKTFIVGAVGIIGVLSLMAGAFLLTIGNIVRMIRVFKEISGLLTIFRGAASGAAAANTGLGASFLLNPVFLFTAAILALGVAFYLLYTKVKGFHDFIDGMWQNIQAGWDGVTKGVNDAWHGFQDFFSGASNGWNAFVQAFDNQGITTGLDSMIGWVERLGNALGDAWRWMGRFGRSASDIFERLPGQVAGFFVGVGTAIGGFFSRLLDTVVGALSGATTAVEKFFDRLPGYISRGLATALGAVGSFLSQLPERIAYWGAFIVGRWIRLWYYDIPKAVGKGGLFVIKNVASFLSKLPGIFGRFTGMVLTNLAAWGVRLVVAVGGIAAQFFNNLVGWISRLPGQIARFTAQIASDIFNWGVGLVQSAGNIAAGIFTSIVGWLTNLPSAIGGLLGTALQWMIAKIPEFTSAAWQIGTGVFNGIIGFFEDLPGNIVSLLLKAVEAVGGFAAAFYNKAKSIATNLWNGFWDGISGSPHTKIEYAMWDMVANMNRSIDDVRAGISQLNGLQGQIPQLNAGTIGLPNSADLALNLNGGGSVWQQNAPLIGQASIRDDRDIVTLARQLNFEYQKTERARGRRR